MTVNNTDPTGFLIRKSLLLAFGLLLSAAATSASIAAADERSMAGQLIDMAGSNAGLCVHLGCGSGRLTAQLASEGNFLVAGLEPNRDLVESARRKLHAVYGLATVRQSSLDKLPFTENLVNLVIADDAVGYKLPIDEIIRVLRPGGVAIVGQSSQAAAGPKALSAGQLRRMLEEAGVEAFDVVEDRGVWARIEKPRPRTLDQWTHPRYDASGNAVSADTVSAPPRRIRWIAGPMRAASYQISAAGRNFYAGITARDAFNGVRIWSRPVEPAPLGGADPVASQKVLFVVHRQKLEAWDAATGETLQTYDAAGTPSEIFHASGILVSVDSGSVRALDAATGKLLWRRSASIPGCVAVSNDAVFYVQGNPRRGEAPAILRVDRKTGKEIWRKTAPRFKPDPDEFQWLARATKCSYHDGLLAVETSTFTDFSEGNAIHVLRAADGSYLSGRTSEPGGHYGQARALFVDGLLWTRDGRHTEGMDPTTGEILKRYPVGTGHCFPPIATPRFMIAGEMHFTDLATGQVDAHHISKGTCSRATGFVPANGLVYVAPKNCVCWPMVKGFVALAPARGESVQTAVGREEGPGDFLLEKSDANIETAPTDSNSTDEWPCYRHDARRSGATESELPQNLTVRWERQLEGVPENQLSADWASNPFVRGPLTPPVVSAGLVFVARPDAHEVVAIGASDGVVRWRHVADGRIDTPPTIWRGLCLFGTHGGWVYCLRAADGRLIWRLHAAAGEERIVAFGQVESPWPVAGSVLIEDGVAYFAAGRQYLADGGIRVFAVDPPTGRIHWVHRVDQLPDHHYYAASGLEFDNFDLLVQEGGRIAMSRWLFDPGTGRTSVVPLSGFAHHRTPDGEVVVPRGHWSYGPRMGRAGDRIVRRPPVVFRGNVLIGCTENRRGLFRRDFTPLACKQFDDQWYSYRKVSRVPVDGGEATRTERLQQGALWLIEDALPEPVGAMILAGDRLCCVTESGRLEVFSIANGRKTADGEIGPLVWDGMAAALGNLYGSTARGSVVCLGEVQGPDRGK